MSENSKIQWTDHTFNPWEGCTKVSPGCANCYAEARNKRWNAGRNWGKGAPRRRTSAPNWQLPIKWNKAACFHHPVRPRVFCASLADWLDDEVPIEWLADLLKLIHDTPNLDWLLLTKRPENWRARVEQAADHHFDHGDRNVCGWLVDWYKHEIAPKNVWAMTTVEDQKRADERIPHLLKIPANVRGLSVEPMLEPVSLPITKPMPIHDDRYGNQHEYYEQNRGIHWAIFGGESGPGARPCNIDWIRNGVMECQEAGVKVFVKQLGSVPVQDNDLRYGQMQGFSRMDLKDRKGGDIEEFPEDLRIREFPA